MCNMDEDNSSILRLLWMNTLITWWILSINVIILLSIWIDGWVYQAIIFLLTSLFSLIAWIRMDNKVRPLL